VLLVALAFLCAGWARGSATVRYDFEQPVFFKPGETVKDHSLIYVDGVFHLYYTTGTGRSLGAAASVDLLHWLPQGDAIEAGPSSWDSAAVWAPAIVHYPAGPGCWLMYYAGVNSSYAQRTCLALSSDLSQWSKASSPMFTPFHGDTLWIHWKENEWSNYRDPGFYREDKTCYLVETAQTKDNKGAIALARSGDYFHWADAGPLYLHNNWHALESPFLMKRNGLYHLFFTEETVGGVSHMSSSSLASGWSIVNRSIIDEGHAAEVLELGSDRYLISRHTSYSSAGGTVATIRIDTLRWNGNEPVVDMLPPLPGWTRLWGTAFDHQPVFGDNPRYRGDDTTRVGYEGNSWIGTYESFAGPLTGTLPGAFQGDEPRGALRSATFTITGRSMRLLVGGGDYPDSCYVALCDAGTGTVIFKETGRNRDLMDQRWWDLSRYSGRAVYILIVDNSSSHFGHINADGIEERASSVPGNGGFTPAPDKGLRKFSKQSMESREPAIAPPNAIHSRPNPFNPSTEIFAVGAPGSTLVITVYDVSGRELTELSARAGADGRASVLWNGRDRSGKTLPSGVYFAALIVRGRVAAVSKLILTR
jgi:hypothetical protein